MMTITITIDGQKYEVEGQKTVLEVAKENNIYIPSLCDYPGLKPFGGCRMCLVEVKGMRGYLPSCSLFAADEMEIITDTPALKKMRREILELILSEHPNACLICAEKSQCDEYKSTIRKVGETTGCVLCPNNGSCDLQDVVEAVGLTEVRFPSLYRNVEVKKRDPFFDRNYNLCILCGRCARVCSEVRGISAISFVYRGSKALIGTVLDKPLQEAGCQFCGACVDSCPTGALFERAAKYERPAETKAETICPLCSMGCRLEVSLVGGRVFSARPVDGPVNRGQACVRGRFVLRDVINSSRRMDRPMIRMDGELEPVTWDEAFEAAAGGFQALKKGEAAVVISPQISNEAHFALKKFAAEVLETDQVTALVPEDPFFAKEPLTYDLNSLEDAETILLMDPGIVQTHTMAWLAVHRAVQKGASLILAGPQTGALERFARLSIPLKPGSEGVFLSYLSKLFLEADRDQEGQDASASAEKPGPDWESVKAATGVEAETLFIQAAAWLSSQKPPAFVFAGEIFREEKTRAALSHIRRLAEGRLYPLGLEANLRGQTAVWEGGVKPLGSVWEGIRSGRIKGLYCCGPIPLPEDIKPEFLLIQDTHFSPLAQRADVLLPAAMPGESEGTMVNTEGRLQRHRAVITPFSEARADWQITASLAGGLGKRGFDWKNAAAVLADMKKKLPAFGKISQAALDRDEEQFLSPAEDEAAPVVPLESGPYQESGGGLKLILQYRPSSFRSLPLGVESRGLALIRNPKTVMISAADASGLGLKNGDAVVLETPAGSLQAAIKVNKHQTPGVCFIGYLWNRDPARILSNILSAETEELKKYGADFPFLTLPVTIKRGE
jgi:formate dehydrogenase alpha subunit